MAEHWLARFGSGAGIMFLPLFVAAQFVAPLAGVPEITVDDATFVRELAAAEYAVRATALLWGLIGLTFLWFVAILYQMLRRTEGAPGWSSLLAFSAGALWSFTALLSALLWHAVTIDAGDVAEYVPSAKTALFIARNLHFSHDLLLVAVLIGVSGLVLRAAPALPSWLSRASLLIAALLLAGSLLLALGQPFPVLPLGFTLFLLWVGTMSVQLARMNRSPAVPNDIIDQAERRRRSG